MTGTDVRDMTGFADRVSAAAVEGAHPARGPLVSVAAVLTLLEHCPAGMTVDGDVLRDVVMDAVPRLLTDEFARDLADRVLDGAAAAGVTVLHSSDGRPVDAAVAECPECGHDTPIRIPNTPSGVSPDVVQAVWDEEGAAGVADWIRNLDGKRQQ